MRGRSPHEFRTQRLSLNHRARVRKADGDIVGIKAKTDNITVSSAVNLNTMNTAVAALPAGLSG